MLFAEYWSDPEDAEADKKAMEKGDLMIGVICDLDGSDEIAVHDTNEVAEAVWIPRDEVQVQDNGVSLTFEMINRFKSGEI